MNYEQHTADAVLALPSGPVLQEYRYIINSMLWNNRTGDNFPSLMLLVGTEDNTAVTITPTEYVTVPYDLRDSDDPRSFIGPGESYTVTLNKMETYQIENSLDLTGSQVVSNKPLSVFAGHECADVPGGVTACDHLFEQVPTTSTWGRFFFLVSSDSSGRISPEWYRIVTSKPFTTITITCFQLVDSLHSFSYNAYVAPVGGFEQFQMERDNYCYAVADKPVLVMQYAYGGSANNGVGDPFMMMILPTEQYFTDTIIHFWAYSNFISDITVVVLQQDYPSNVLLDGITHTSDWIELYCSEHELCGYTLRLPVITGFHSIKHLNSSVPVAVYVYGFEYYQGYGYPAALSLKNLELLECSDGGVRLVDGDMVTEGRVEVCQGGQWGTVCSDLWTPEDTDVVCGQLGLLSSGITGNFYGEGQGPIFLDNVECLGVESSILECLYDTHTSDCSHYQDAGALCLHYPEPIVELTWSPNTNQVFAGYNLMFSCFILVNSDVIDRVIVATMWYKDGIEYNVNWDSRISVTPATQTSDGVYVTTLTFTPLNSGDSGNYQCTAILTGFTGTSLANATNSTTLAVENLQQTLVQLQLFGVQNCYEWIQASSADIDKVLVTTISAGVEEICQCGFSVHNLNQITPQCFHDNQEKINIFLFLQQTPTKNTSEIISTMNTWINSNPQIVLNDSNITLTIDSACDITKIQNSDCNRNTQPPISPSTTTQTSPSPFHNATSTARPSVVKSESKGQDTVVAGVVLVTIAVVVIVISVAIVLIVLVKYRVIKVDSFKISDRLRVFRVLYHSGHTHSLNDYIS
jgi:hypothetical protein